MLCKIGIHDKELVNAMNCMMHIRVCLDGLKPTEENETIATRDFFIELDAQNIYTNLYGSRHRGSIGNWHNYNVNDYVCLRCGKCFKNIEIEKMWIEGHVKIYLKKAKNRKIRKQMAIDLYRENCEEH